MRVSKCAVCIHVVCTRKMLLKDSSGHCYLSEFSMLRVSLEAHGLSSFQRLLVERAWASLLPDSLFRTAPFAALDIASVSPAFI